MKAYNNSRRAIFTPLIISIAIIIGMFAGKMLSSNKSVVSTSAERQVYGKLDMIIGMIDHNYVDTVDSKKMVEDAIPLLLKSLDPHTVYIPAKQFENANADLRGNFGGIGVQFIMFKDTVTVVKVVQGGPSEKYGLIDGDRIVKVNDTLIAGIKMNNTKIMGMMRGIIGSEVKVTIKRKGKKNLLSKNIIRGSIPISSIDVFYMIDKEVGYIKVNKFAMNTYEKFMKGLDSLRNQGMKRLIVDLRENSGGFMGNAVNMINEFLSEKKLIVYTKGKSTSRTDYLSNGNGKYLDIPLVVVIDEGSASASEIFAGAIQDNDRGTIIGRRSFGKGLVQEQRQFSDGSAIRLTVSRYYSPSGRCIQKSYKNGKESYYQDVVKRYLHGELTEKDSIHFDKKLKYKTLNGRTVYGGGGIMPDIFIPIDTCGVSNYLRNLAEKSIIYRYSFEFVDYHRDDLKDVKDYKKIVEYAKRHKVLEGLVTYAQKDGIKRDTKGFRISKKIIETRLYAYICRHIIDDEGFYPILREIDNTLNKAYEVVKNK